MFVDTAYGRRTTADSSYDTIARFYDLASPYYLKLWGEHIHDGYYATGEESRTQAQRDLVRVLARKADVKVGERVLDIGCGLGGGSIWLSEQLGAGVIGITISPVQARLAARRAAEQEADSAFFLMDAEHMALARRPFLDIAWAVAVMSHFRDQMHFLEEISVMLKPGGRIVIYDWMLGSAVNYSDDATVAAVSVGFMLPSLFSMQQYLSRLAALGFQPLYAEDITDHTLKTWDDAISFVRQPAIIRLALRAGRQERNEALKFARTLPAMRRALRERKLVSAAIVAEKL